MSFMKRLTGGASKGPGSDPVETMKRRQAAATEVLAIFEENFSTTFESHPATVLRAAAWLAGTSLYRSFGFKPGMAPGTVVLSDQANEEGPKLMNLYLAILPRSGINLGPKDVVVQTPEQYKPRKDILQVQELFQDRYNEIMRRHGFGYVEGAQVGAFVCGILTEAHCKSHRDLEPGLAAGIVTMGFVEGTKTCPAPLKSMA